MIEIAPPGPGSNIWGTFAAGLVQPGRAPYLGAMQFFARLSPLRAIRDLRFFLAQRRPHELGFLVLAILLTGIVLIGFAKDSAIQPVYRPDIIYVKQWTLDRTDAQIRAQQAIDEPIKQRKLAEERKRQAELQAEFKKLDDRLTKLGI